MTKISKATMSNNDELVTVFRAYVHPFDPEQAIVLTFNIPESQVRTYRYPNKQEAYEIFLSNRQTL